MARYGSGGEDFSAEAAELRALREQREAMIARERQVQAELAETTGLQEQSARAEQTRRRAKTESREVSRREAQAGQEAVRATNLDTQAIERNTQARRRNAEAARRQQLSTSRALSGARDPMFAAAYGIRGAETTQYAMRQQLEGVGSRRARAMQEAMQLGYRPAGPAADPLGPVTRAQAALTSKAAADLEAAQATREYTNIQKRAGVTVADVEAALVAKETARARAKAADVELESARNAEAASRANEQAIRNETRGREQVTRAKVDEARRTQAVALGPTGRREPYGLLPAAGQTTQMPMVSSPVLGRRVPGPPRPDIREVGGGGTVGTPQGDVAYAERQEQAAAAARATANEIRGQNEVLAANALAAGRAGEAARIYADDLGDTTRAAHALDQARADEFMERTARQAHLMGRATRDAGINFYPLSQAMHRHGALTTEFIAAAARGETTVKELGNQALLTAGKFAGWTLAATAVYGVAGALHAVAQGALDAQSGTEQAFRVITDNRNADALRGAFGDLAGQFNVPIDVASDAVYRMGQVFHDQADAVKAAEAALYSYKTGEVDVATSTRNLIAIVNGFGLSSDELVNVFDQINEAQNRFGISIGDTEAGLAKAAGSFRSSGGDLDYLLGLFIAIQKATGRSGTEIGTGISRAVQRIREPISIEKLTAQGVEVDPTNLQKTLKNALARVAAAPADVDVQEIATGLFGNQYARLISPVLQDQTLLNKALAETSPEKAKGSAQRELAQVLKEANEQIQQIGVNLQRMGVELQRAGAFNFLLLGLRMFNELLDVTTRVLDVFNALPAPLRTAVTMFGQLAVAVALLRKLGATERLADTPFGFLAAPQARERTHALAGLRRAQQEARNIAERAGVAAVQAGFEVDQRRLAVERHRPIAAAGARLAVDDPDAIRIRQRTAQLEAGLLQSQVALEDAVIRRTAAEKVVTATTADLAAIQKASAAETRAILAQRGIAYPARLDQPNTQGVIMPGGGPAAAATLGDEAATAAAATGTTTALRQSRKRRQVAQAIGRQTTEVMTNARFSLLAATGGRNLGRAYDALERVGDTAVRGMQRAGAQAASAGQSLRRLPGSVMNLVRGLGVIDFAILGFIAFEAIDSVIDKLDDDLDKTQKFLDNYRGDTQKAQNDLQTKVQRLRDEGTDPTFSDKLAKLNDIFNPVEIFGSTIPEALRGEYEDPRSRRRNQLAEAEQLLTEQNARAKMQAAQARAGVPRQQLTADELISDENQDYRDLQAGLISRREFRRRLALHQEELKFLLGTDRQKGRATARTAALARAGGTPGDYRDAIADLGPEELQQEMQAIQATASFTGDTGAALRKLTIAYYEQVNDLAGKTDAKSILAMAQAREDYYQAVEQMVDDELQASLSIAGGDEGARRAAFRRAARRYRNQLTGPRSDARGRLEESRSDLEGAKRRRDFLREQLDNQLPTVDEVTGDDLGRLPDNKREQQLRRDLEKANKDVERYRRRRKKFKDEFDEAKKQQAELERKLDQASYEDRETGREIRLQLRISQTADRGQQIALELSAARTQVKDAAETFGRNSREYRQALTDLNNVRMEAAQQMLRDVDAENSLMIALAGSDPGAQARARAQAERNRLNAMLKDAGKFDPNDIKEQRARVIEADNALNEYAKQQAEDVADLRSQIAQARAEGDPVRQTRIALRAARQKLRTADSLPDRLRAILEIVQLTNQLEDNLKEAASARFDLLASRTEDPVKIANIELREANYNLRHTRKGTPEYKRALAERNRARTNKRNTYIDSRQDDINFALEMDQITNEQAAKQLEALAKIKGISKQKKRELLLAAKRLRDEAEGEYDIDLGSVKLPTLYEIRRFVQGGMPVGPTGSAQVNNNQSINITVNSEGDMQRVVKVLEDNLNGTNKSIARNVGVR